jgi:hypothetical protein
MMLRPVALAFAVLSSTTLSFAQDETVAFTRKAPSKGDVRTDTTANSSELAMQISMGGQVMQSMDQKQSQDSVWRYTVLEMAGDAIKSMKVHCEKEVTRVMGSDTPSPYVGETLVATVEDVESPDDVDMRTVEDKEVEDEDLATALGSKASGRIGMRYARYSSFLPDRPVKVGESFKIEGDAAREMFEGGQQDPDAVTITYTLKGREEFGGCECAKFAVEMVVNMKDPRGLVFDLKMKGDLLIDTATSWFHKMDLAGEMKLSGSMAASGQELEVSGKGPMTMKQVATYSKS